MVYHNFWGLHFFADLDRAGRRLGVVHSFFPGLPQVLRGSRGLLDGMLCVSQPLLELVRRELPELAGDRTGLLPYPVARPRAETAQPPLAGRPLTLGYAGRLSFEQKRVDRFPPLVRALETAGVDFQLEFLGDGAQAGWLCGQLASHPRVRFHGLLTGEAYWSVLRRWDVLVFVTDYEGLPITLLEALSVGVLPLFPAIGSGGDDYAAQLRPDLLYPAGDLAAAAAAARRLAGAPEPEIAALRQRANDLVRPHLGDGYGRTFAGSVARVGELPRRSRAVFGRRPLYLADRLPLGVVGRVFPAAVWRCGP
jgi:glycosyltransferase involved in cell wall biosynthesis